MHQSPSPSTVNIEQQSRNNLLPTPATNVQIHIQKQKSGVKCPPNRSSLSKSNAYQTGKAYLNNSLQRETVRNSNSRQFLKRCSTENEIRLSSKNLEHKLHSASNQNLRTVQSFIRSHKSQGKQNWKGSPQSYLKERQTMGGQRHRTHEVPSKKVILKRKQKLTCTQSSNFKTELGRSCQNKVPVRKSIGRCGPCGKKVNKQSINSMPSEVYWPSSSGSVVKASSKTKTEAGVSKPNEARVIMKQYQFIQQYITFLELQGLLNEYQLRGQPHCKWGLLAIDETFHRIKGFQENKNHF